MGLETWECWAEKHPGGRWVRIGYGREGEEQDTFDDKAKALAAAARVAELDDTIEAVVIERRPCHRINGPALRALPAKPNPNLRLLDNIARGVAEKGGPGGTAL